MWGILNVTYIWEFCLRCWILFQKVSKEQQKIRKRFSKRIWLALFILFVISSPFSLVPHAVVKVIYYVLWGQYDLLCWQLTVMIYSNCLVWQSKSGKMFLWLFGYQKYLPWRCLVMSQDELQPSVLLSSCMHLCIFASKYNPYIVL